MQASKSITPRARLLMSCLQCPVLSPGEPAPATPCARGRQTSEAAIVRHLGRGEVLCREGEDFDCLYIVRSGAFRCACRPESGRETVTAFMLPGDVVGLDAIGDGVHRQGVLALVDSSVCAIPFDELESVGAGHPRLMDRLHRQMARELTRMHSRKFMLTRLTALQRTAAFLDDLRARSGAAATAGGAIHLAMQRQDIASYLNLDVCTVSRCLAQLDRLGCLRLEHRDVRVLDAPSLQRLAGGGTTSEALPRARGARPSTANHQRPDERDDRPQPGVQRA